jgi:hypothetical protein
MPSPLRRLALVILLTTVAFPRAAARQSGAQVPTPEAHFRFRMGATGRLTVSRSTSRRWHRNMTE